MYKAISDFLQTLSAGNSALWTLFVLGVVATISLGLYAFWEITLRAVFAPLFRRSKNRQSKG